MSTFKEFLNEQLEDTAFRAEYEALEPEFAIVKAIIDARKTTGLTQKQLSEITGINLGDLSSLESGDADPTLSMLKQLASGMGMTLRLSFYPAENKSINNIKI
jgi:transcriptional regulator with XRE-family HTH domain